MEAIREAEHEKLLKKSHIIICPSKDFSLLQRKIFNVLQYYALNESRAADKHIVDISKLCEMIEYCSNDHKLVKNKLLELFHTTFHLKFIDKRDLTERFILNDVSFFLSMHINGAACEYTLHGEIKKLLLHYSFYDIKKLAVQPKFKSKYGLAFYDICNQLRNSKALYIDVDDLKFLMGIDRDKYKAFKDFQIRVLNKAIFEINNLTDFCVKLIFFRQNRQVRSIKIEISNKKNSLKNI